MEAAAADAEKANVEKCKAAQDRYQNYIDARRLFRESRRQARLPDGRGAHRSPRPRQAGRHRLLQLIRGKRAK